MSSFMSRIPVFAIIALLIVCLKPSDILAQDGISVGMRIPVYFHFSDVKNRENRLIFPEQVPELRYGFAVNMDRKKHSAQLFLGVGKDRFVQNSRLGRFSTNPNLQIIPTSTLKVSASRWLLSASSVYKYSIFDADRFRLMPFLGAEILLTGKSESVLFSVISNNNPPETFNFLGAEFSDNRVFLGVLLGSSVRYGVSDRLLFEFDYGVRLSGKSEMARATTQYGLNEDQEFTETAKKSASAIFIAASLVWNFDSKKVQN